MDAIGRAPGLAGFNLTHQIVVFPSYLLISP